MVPLALAAWPIICVTALLTMPRRKAMIGLVVFGWMFMPGLQSGTIPFFHGKTEYFCGVLFLTSLAVDSGRWRRLRRSKFDLPVFCFALLAACSSLSNGYGVWDAVNQSVNSFFSWTAPYLLGRVYLGDLAGVRELAIGFVSGVMVYVPLCLWEIRMSPQLNYLVYGIQGTFTQMIRAGGYRPQVFMAHGLMLSLWMGMGAVVAWWLWRSKAVDAIWRVPIKWVALLLLGTEVLCKSTGALVLSGLGILLYHSSRRLRTSLTIVALLALPPAYCLLRVNGWSANDLVGSASQIFSNERGESLDFRVRNEDRLIDKAIRQPWLGWGRWGENRVRDAEGRDLTVTDGLWIIVLGNDGALSLLCLALAMIVPVSLLLVLAPPQAWTHPALAPAGALAVALACFLIDCIPNAMTNPFYIFAGGGLTGTYLGALAASPARSRRGRARAVAIRTQAVQLRGA